MSAAEFLLSLSAESLALLSGVALLLAIVVALQIRNTRWLRQLATMEEALAAKVRVERLLKAVERLSSGGASVSATARRNRPLDKGKRVPAIRSATARSTTRRAR